MAHLNDDITTLKGVGPKKAERLAIMGISTVMDLLRHFPRDYEDRRYTVAISDLVPGKRQLVWGTVCRVQRPAFVKSGKRLVKITISDGTRNLELVYFNAPYIANNLKTGTDYYFYGNVNDNRGKLQMVHPEFANGAEGLVPVYPLTKGINQNDLRKYIKQAMSCIDEIDGTLPTDLINEKNLCDIRQAYRSIHFPSDVNDIDSAKKRMIYEDLFVIQTGLLMMKRGKKKGMSFEAPVDDFISSLTFSLTGAQQRVIDEICRDLSSDVAMNRLLEGDVGSGKTLVAEAAMYKVVKSGYQAAFMAPTDLLMKQHYENMKRDFEPHGIRVGYLSGRMKPSEKKDTLKDLAAGEIDVVVGTHALIQEGVEFADLGLVITDEQHRFGVNQRVSLKGKGEEPDILVMTATPIPRTMAVVIYGDLDVSVLDEMPPGRMPIITRYYDDSRRTDIYHRLTSQLDEGRQVYVVCPLISDSDVIDARSAESVHEELQRLYRGRNVGLLHGEMKAEEKDQIMNAFANGEIDVLVSTVVIEVGIDVANATVMIIENAERFGLAQLHQLRGRVGRGEHQSFCMLLMGSTGEIAMKRAGVMAESSDGFYIAEMDLDLRGPGEVFGTRQHGINSSGLSDMVSHLDIMEELRGTAMDILKDDPGLEKDENKELASKVNALFNEGVAMSL